MLAISTLRRKRSRNSRSHSKFEASMGCKRPCLKTNQETYPLPQASQARWIMSVIPALGKLSQEECSECEASLGYRVTPGSTHL